MAKRSLSDEQKRHVASTLRIAGIGAFVVYGYPEVTAKALVASSLTSHFAGGGFLLFGFSLFTSAEFMAVRVLEGVN